MYYHFIILASSYFLKTRIALDYVSDGDIDVKLICEDVAKIKEKCGKDILISLHTLQVNGPNIKDVANYDHFFKGVLKVESVDKFISILLKDRELQGLDVAKYILTIIPCSHLKLEKLVYLCYLDYLLKTNEPLFVNDIYSSSFGPISKSIYANFMDKDIDDSTNYGIKNSALPLRSKLIASRDGIRKLNVIEDTIHKYKDCLITDLDNIISNKYYQLEI